MKHKIGQLVVNKKLGLGKVLEVRGDNVTVFFKDHPDTPRVINVLVMPMEIPKEQTDEELDNPKQSRKNGKGLFSRMRTAKRLGAKAATKKAKAAHP